MTKTPVVTTSGVFSRKEMDMASTNSLVPSTSMIAQYSANVRPMTFPMGFENTSSAILTRFCSGKANDTDPTSHAIASPTRPPSTTDIHAAVPATGVNNLAAARNPVEKTIT
jgi:hypothetical protein